MARPAVGLLSTATIALALFVLGAFLLVTANLQRLGDGVEQRRRNVGVSEGRHHEPASARTSSGR